MLYASQIVKFRDSSKNTFTKTSKTPPQQCNAKAKASLPSNLGTSRLTGRSLGRSVAQALEHLKACRSVAQALEHEG